MFPPLNLTHASTKVYRKPYRFSLRVPKNNVLSCGTKASWRRKMSNPISRVLRPSISIVPFFNSTMLQIENKYQMDNKEDHAHRNKA